VSQKGFGAHLVAEAKRERSDEDLQSVVPVNPWGEFMPLERIRLASSQTFTTALPQTVRNHPVSARLQPRRLSAGTESRPTVVKAK
jgi:hypothetical protein